MHKKFLAREEKYILDGDRDELRNIRNELAILRTNGVDSTPKTIDRIPTEVPIVRADNKYPSYTRRLPEGAGNEINMSAPNLEHKGSSSGRSPARKVENDYDAGDDVEKTLAQVDSINGKINELLDRGYVEDDDLIVELKSQLAQLI